MRLEGLFYFLGWNIRLGKVHESLRVPFLDPSYRVAVSTHKGIFLTPLSNLAYAPLKSLGRLFEQVQHFKT